MFAYPGKHMKLSQGEAENLNWSITWKTYLKDRLSISKNASVLVYNCPTKCARSEILCYINYPRTELNEASQFIVKISAAPVPKPVKSVTCTSLTYKHSCKDPK